MRINGFRSALLAALVVASLMVPTSTSSPENVTCELEVIGDGIAEWTSEIAHSGNYSVKLTIPENSSPGSWAIVKVPYGKALSILTSAPSFYLYANVEHSTRFALYLDKTGNGEVDNLLLSDYLENIENGKWTTGTGGLRWGWTETPYPPYTYGEIWQSFDNWQNLYSDATVLYVAVALEYWGVPELAFGEPLYVDDVIVNGIIYDLELGLIPRDPIYIEGNDNFTPANGVTGGSGMENDPYIIENWVINASTAHGIKIINTTAYFVARNSVVENGGGTYDGIYLDNVVNGRIENNTCENNRHSIYLFFSDHNTLSNNTCENNIYDGINLEDSDNNTLYNNTTNRENASYGTYGIYLTNSDNNTLSNNTCQNNENGISLDYYSDHNTLSNNTCENNSSGIYLSYSSNNNLDNNILKNNYRGIYLNRSPNNLLRNNVFLNNSLNLGVGIRLVSDGYQDIDTSNTINGKPVYRPVGEENLIFDGSVIDIGYLGLVSCENVLVKNLSISNSINGIELIDISNSTIMSSTFSNNNNGIFLSFSLNNIVENCTVENNGTGIRLSDSSNNTLSNNTCENNRDYGIRLRFSDNNTLDNNTCENSYSGIHLYNSSNNTLSNNTCENNDNGIHISASSNNNTLFHNYLLSNTDNNAHDSCTNYWDNGYPSGGNYWSDYTGKDENYGENQDIPSWSDGIGDTPYNIPGGANKDLYPLVFRNFELIVDPDSQAGVIGENVVFTVTVMNAGNVWDNYKLTAGGDAGWPLELDNDYLEIPMNENRETKLTVSIPDDENLVCTTDNITFSVMAGNVLHLYLGIANVHAVSSWSGTATFSLVNLYTVNVEKILDLNQGSKLVVKFYTYGDAFENENVIENFSPPWHVEENESARHPEGVGVKKARLDLTTDNTEDVISTIASFTVTQTMLEVRFTEIPFEWALAGTPEERTELETEFSEVPLYWALAPS